MAKINVILLRQVAKMKAPIQRRHASTVVMGQFENGQLYGNTNDWRVRGDDFANVDQIYTDLNRKALKDFQKLHGYFSPKNNDVVLDFGCGSGETTAGMAKGQLVHEKPQMVLGLDISQRKVSSCQESFSEVPNLSFERFNANNETHRREFLEKWKNKVSLVTIFSSAHHLDDAPTCVKFFSEILRDGGKLVALVPFQSSQANTFARAFETVLGSEKWSERLQRMRLPCRMTCDVWLPPSEQEQDQEQHSKEFQRLLEHHGFTTEQLKELRAKITMDIAECPQLMWDAWNDLEHEVKAELFDDVRQVHVERLGPMPDEYIDVLDMFRIMASKNFPDSFGK